MLRTVTFLALLVGCSLAYKSYDGYKTVRTEVLTATKAKHLNTLMLNSIKFDFWKEPSVGRQADIMASPDDFAHLTKLLHGLGIRYDILVEDVQKVLDANRIAPGSVEGRYTIDWNNYYTYAQITTFLNEVAAKDNAFTTKSIGKTVENRDIMALELKKSTTGRNIFVESNIHAREWISHATGTFLIQQLVDVEPSYLDQFNFYFVPVANPDGYEYSRTTDRMWRKNRAPTSGSCVGTDLNRNWPFHWGEAGTNNVTCSDTYGGSAPLSEKESQSISTYWTSIKSGSNGKAPNLSLCLHSYGQLMLVPYGYAIGAYAPDYDEMTRVADLANADLRAVHNKVYTVENSAGLYPAAGASDDWYKSQGSDYTYTFELRDTGTFGFQLPANQITPTGEEV